jgi:hypothetical protein
MIAGLITPPIIFANYLALDASYQSYMISASLISSGILSMIQMSRIHLFKGYYLGCGILCVVGTSFGMSLPDCRAVRWKAHCSRGAEQQHYRSGLQPLTLYTPMERVNTPHWLTVPRPRRLVPKHSAILSGPQLCVL